MFKNIAAAALILFGSVAPSYSQQMTGGTYFFRFLKSGIADAQPVDDSGDSKNITAVFAGAIGLPFSQKIPMRSEWEADNWVVTSGTLPNGLAFDATSQTFSGTPTFAAMGQVVTLVGYDTTGAEVGKASVTFDIYALPDGNAFSVHLYGHTNKYSFNQLVVPTGIVVDHWKKFYSLPPGVELIGRNVDGTPTAAANYPLLIEGFDFLNNPIVGFIGDFTVQDGPVFNQIPDKLYTHDVQYDALEIGFDNEKVQQTISGASGMRYYVETQNNTNLPGSVTVGSNVQNRHISGQITQYYDQATIRYKAVDSDNAVGYSNWFKLGLLGPTPTCGNYETGLRTNIPGIVGQALSYAIPTMDSKGTRSYALTSGTLPGGLTLTPKGVITGTPTKEETQSGIAVEVSVTNGTNVDKTTCGPYTFGISPANFTLAGTISPADFHIGTTVSGSLAVGGGVIAPWAVTINDATALPSTVKYDQTTRTLAGVVNEAGIYHPSFTLTNGDGKTRTASISFTARNPLAIGTVTTNPVARYESVDGEALPGIAIADIDASTVVGSANVTAVDGSGNPLPTGMSVSFNGTTASILGGTTLPSNTYGPYHFHVTDSDVVAKDSNPFSIVVGPRAGLTPLATIPPVFTINKAVSIKPFEATEPALATSLVKTYTLSGPPLPAGFSFDKSTGILSGLGTVKQTLDGYKVVITDNDGGQATSDPFALVIQDPANIPDIQLGAVTKNVTGPSVTYLATQKPDLSPVSSYIVGSISQVKFTSTTPDVKTLGLNFHSDTGIIEGNPTAEYDGVVDINFEDSAGRPGKAVLKLTVLPYPAITPSNLTYQLPRLADASLSAIQVQPNTGFIGSIVYTLAPSSVKLPDGLSLTKNQITGSTNVAAHLYENVVVHAKDTASGIEVDSPPFAINLVDRVSMGLALTPETVDYFLNSDLSLSSNKVFTPAPTPTGSAVKPLTWSITGTNGSGLGINQTTGQLTGTPAGVGRWPLTIRVQDSDTPAQTASDTVTIWSSLDGFPNLTPGGQSITVRAGETFATAAEVVKNCVGLSPATCNSGSTTTGSLSWLPKSQPSWLTFDSSKAVFTGRPDTSGNWNWALNVSDADSRSMLVDSNFSVTSVPALKFVGKVKPSYTATQYSVDNAIVIQFPVVTNALGTVNYGISGSLPGTLVYKYKGSYSKVTSSGLLPIAAEDLPNDTLLFDTETATLVGIPSKSGTYANLTVFAYDDYQDHGYKGTGYIVPGDPNRVANNSDTTSPFSIIITAAPDIALVSTENPKSVVAPGGNADVSVTATNVPYGLDASWTLTDADKLPAGITYAIKDNIVSFTGLSQEKATYVVGLKATDSTGSVGQGTLNQTFKVTLSTDPIVLSVADITTKVGQPVSMQVPYASAQISTSNSIGQLRFSSDDAAQYGLTVNPTTGEVGGTLTATQQFTFNIKVQDETNRLTSQAVKVTVEPQIRTIVGTLVGGVQGANVNIPVDTAYVLGTAAYRITPGQESQWPSGVSVNPTTGAITGTLTAAVGDYAGLTITATDTTGDSAPSNVFTFRVNPIDALPVIADVSSNKMAFGTVGTAFDYVPTVTDSKNKLAWPGVLSFKLNHNLPADTGLTFNTSTGEISGTPTSPVYYSDLTITVTSERGDTDATAPFVFGIQPAGPVSAVDGQTVAYTLRSGLATTIPAPAFTGLYLPSGVTYTILSGARPTGLSLDATTGILSGTPTTVSTYNYSITAKDIFGRSAAVAFIDKVVAQSVVSVKTLTSNIDVDQAYTSINTPTTTNPVGTLSYVIGGLPVGLDYDRATGAVSGTVTSASYSQPQTYSVTVTVHDSADPAMAATASYTLNVQKPLVAADGQKLTYYGRANVAGKTDAPIFNNAVGALTYTQSLSGSNYTIDANGVVTFTSPGQSAGIVETVTARDSLGRTATLKLTLVINSTLQLSFKTPTTGINSGVKYTSINAATLTGSIGTVTYSATGLPTGLQVNSVDGTITGTVPASAYPNGTTFPVVVTATDAYDNATDTATYTLTVANPVTPKAGLTTTYVERVSEAYTADAPLFDNTVGTVTYTQTGAPTGTVFAASTGIISGTPNKAGTYTVVITAKDSTGRTGTFTYTVTVNAAFTIAVPAQSLVQGNDVGNSQWATVSGGLGTLTYSASNLPNGLSINASTGAITGTTNVDLGGGSSTVISSTISVTDDFHNITKSALFNVTVGTYTHRYWQFTANSSLTLVELELYDDNGNLLDTSASGYVFDGSKSTASTSVGYSNGSSSLMPMADKLPHTVKKLIVYLKSNSTPSAAPTLRWSDDNVKFYALPTASVTYTGGNATTYQY